MAPEWKGFCRGRKLRVGENEVEVELADGRQHRVQITEHEDALHLSAVVGRASVVDGVENAALRIWQRNREMQIVGFRLDARGRLLGEAWIPRLGLTSEEFVMCLHTVALESDRLEFLLTGRDQE